MNTVNSALKITVTVGGGTYTPPTPPTTGAIGSTFVIGTSALA